MPSSKDTQHLLHSHGCNADEIIRAIPNEQHTIKACDIFQQLSDPTRLKILWLLAHSEQCVNNIALAVNMSAPAVSHHLRMLRQADLITHRRAGKEIYYKLNTDKKSQLVHKIIDDIFEMNCCEQN